MLQWRYRPKDLLTLQNCAEAGEEVQAQETRKSKLRCINKLEPNETNSSEWTDALGQHLLAFML
jgi:hypothetical protein